jgi:hypothetical protein
MADNWVPAHKMLGEREAYLGFALILWIGILTGFVPEVATEGFNYPVIVHLHAMTFGGWLILLTTQCLFIRSNRRDLHRKLGIAAAVLAAAMLIIGSLTALTMDRIHFAEDGKPPIFASVQFADLIVFAILIPAGFALRKRAQLHKTLMMLASIALSVAGFARGFGSLIAPLFPPGKVQFYEHIYGGTDLVMLAFVVYHAASRRTLNPALVLGCLLIVALHVTATQLYFWQGWIEISRRIVGV